jgi:hypothetical protein
MSELMGISAAKWVTLPTNLLEAEINIFLASQDCFGCGVEVKRRMTEQTVSAEEERQAIDSTRAIMMAGKLPYQELLVLNLRSGESRDQPMETDTASIDFASQMRYLKYLTTYERTVFVIASGKIDERQYGELTIIDSYPDGKSFDGRRLKAMYLKIVRAHSRHGD